MTDTGRTKASDPNVSTEPKKDEKPEFIPKKYARKTCGTCRGSGVLHYSVYAGNQNNVTKPCGCAAKRYLKAVRGY